MTKLRGLTFGAEMFATLISGVALLATVISAWSSYNALTVSRQSQTSQLFLQFQEDYTSVSSRFPNELRDPAFRPPRSSEAFRRLEEYWIFLFAEWFATHDLDDGAYVSLWHDYYAALAQGALDIPSLRYVLADMMQRRDAYRGSFPQFFAELARLSREAGDPLPVPP